jgi:heme/copper-type cytochrome/quinol oxidase subunit 4
MDSTLATYLMLWAISGAALGGVVTPILARDRRVNDWLAAIGGTLIGLVGNVVLLAPLWIVLQRMEARPYTQPMWRYDAMTPAEAAALGERSYSVMELGGIALPALKTELWPQARAEGGHSHRRTYVGVFVALALLTASEVILTVTEPFPVIGPLVALSSLKVVLVVMYFMHLRFDDLRYTLMFVSAVPFAVLVLAVLAAVA